ncbi:protein ALP1-like [Beta vulgaris subsp. vulgaris]|uniref:protein ALP1-like n=1 Tax=Beta vulgaris subsp. vulgaris TaxID=3555 RepID=UPI002036DF5C|nr:protein ALP1-like [Beta vulgaris subsp. vulgaris]
MIVRSDIACIEQLRMDRHTFNILCSLVREIGGLRDTKNMVVEEMMAMFLHILAFEEKNREIKYDFQRSGETISRHFHDVLRAVLKLSRVLLKKPEPIPEDSTDERWKWFKNCIGALDGTLIDVTVPVDDKSRYRSRKNTISTNVLGACAPDLQFIYVLAGWEGSAADGRVLRSALERDNGLKVPRGNYYLADLGYKHCEGFLVPYRNIRYHEWRRGNEQPNSKEELYNMKHASARNVIERAFRLLKMRWGALSKGTKYPLNTQIDIILACVYIHNLICQQMGVDPMKQSQMNLCKNLMMMMMMKMMWT